MSVPIEDFEVNYYGGEERGMGYENIIDLVYEYPCDNCDNDISINFSVSEYPLGMVNFILDNSKGAQTLNEPKTIDIDDSPIYIMPSPSIIVPDNRIITDLSGINNAIPRLIDLIQQDNSYIHRITPREFEEVIVEIFRDKGFEVELTQRTRDGGKDIIAIHRNELGIDTQYFVECKRHAPTNKVGVGIVRQLYGVHAATGGPNKSIIATTSTFTSGAIDFANNSTKSEWNMDLKDISHVLSWIYKYRA